jgi:hypothetical protein
MKHEEWKDGEPLRFELNLNVLHHLGVQLYASTPSAITEIIANAWDADAAKVEVIIDGDELVVSDDGHGMTRHDVQKRFLNIGYNRREFDGNQGKSLSDKRRVMGRKGIGKLALFSVADYIEVHTQAEGKPAVQFTINVEELSKAAKADTPYLPTENKSPPQHKGGHGTTIILRKLKRSASRTESYLRPRLARRFGVLGPTYGFEVRINDVLVTRADAKIYDDLQFLWYFDDEGRAEAERFAPRIAEIEQDDGTKRRCVERITIPITYEGKSLEVRGFIGTVDKPSKLGKEDESINQIALFARGRLFQEDLLAHIGDARVFNTYVIGEIHADFLDDDDVDRATSAREAVFRDDPLVQLVMSHVKEALRSIRDKWDEWRLAVKPIEEGATDEILQKWLDSLPEERDRKQAKKLLKSIEAVEVSNNESRNKDARALLYRSAIVGFEKLRVRKNLDALDKITDVFSPEFQALFSNIDDIEETYFRDISKQRLDVIEKFEGYVDSEALEKVVQDYLFDHLWLLDPTWDRISGTQQKEVTLTDYLKKSCPDTEDGARLDVAYRLQSGRHVVVELKRPGLKTSWDKISSQCNRYRRSVTEFTSQHGTWIDGSGDGSAPVIIYFLMSDRSHIDNEEEKSLAALNVKIVTYKTMILSARAAYEEYFQSRAKVGQLQALLDKL